MTRFTLYGIALSGPSYKVGLMLRLCGEAFMYEHVDLRSGVHKTPSFLSKNRFGQVPALEDAQTGLRLCQSSSILEYLEEETGKFGGQTKAERLTAREWQFWGAGNLAMGIYRTRALKLGFFKAAPDVAESYKTGALASLKELNSLLEGKNWLVGSAATIADIDLYAIVAYCNQAEIDLTPYPHVQAWLGHVEGLAGFKGVNDLLHMVSQKIEILAPT